MRMTCMRMIEMLQVLEPVLVATMASFGYIVPRGLTLAFDSHVQVGLSQT